MRLFHVNAHDDAEFAAWFAVLHRSELKRDAGRDEGWRPAEWRARANDESGASYHQLFSYGETALRPVAVGALEVSRLDNLQWMRGELFVDPDERRNGYGSALLGHLEAHARQHRRSSLVFWVVEDGWEQGAGPNRGFAPRHDYHVVQENVVRDLLWPRPEGEIDRLEASWRPFGEDYDVLSWRGATPQALLAQRARLSAIMPVEVPDVGIGQEEERWDDERVRQHEARTNEMGRDLLVAVAQHRNSAAVVGFSELTVSRDHPTTAYQWDTLVVRAHRGHRLGGLLKIATMRLLESGGYRTEKIMTSNDATNAPMIAVNEAFGFVESGRIVTWRKSLT